MKNKNVLNIFIRSLMFFASFILFIAAFMLPSLIFKGKYSNNPIAWIIIFLAMLFIITFGISCLLLATKFKYELTLNDKEKLLNWDKLSLAYKKFWIFQEIFTLFLGLFILILGLIFSIFFRDILGAMSIVFGSALLISVRKQYLEIKEKKEAKILKRILQKIAKIGLIFFAIALIVWLILNFGKILM